MHKFIKTLIATALIYLGVNLTNLAFGGDTNDVTHILLLIIMMWMLINEED